MIKVFLFFILFPIITLAQYEVWAYVMNKEEKNFPKESIITDIAHFDAKIISDGLISNPMKNPPSINYVSENVRRHLVITAPHNSELSHYYLDPNLPLRNKIITNIVKESKTYDGIQIDFEAVHSNDGTAFLNFLIDLKKSLPKEKILSVAVLARWESHKKNNPLDAYDYKLIGKIADRVIVMAYDEHWRTGPPGPIASIPWCRKIFTHALKTIPNQKIIMGIPLYGRAWQTKILPNVSKQKDIINKMKNLKIQNIKNTDSGGSFQYKEEATINIFHETYESIKAKKKLYLSYPIKGTAYWRVGQEPDLFWEKFIN